MDECRMHRHCTMTLHKTIYMWNQHNYRNDMMVACFLLHISKRFMFYNQKIILCHSRTKTNRNYIEIITKKYCRQSFQSKSFDCRQINVNKICITFEKSLLKYEWILHSFRIQICQLLSRSLFVCIVPKSESIKSVNHWLPIVYGKFVYRSQFVD